METGFVRLEAQRIDAVDGLLKTLPHNTWQRQFWENVRGALTRRWRGRGYE